jgi:hypothetical protein
MVQMKPNLITTKLEAVINYNYTLLTARVPALSLVCRGGRGNADTKGFELD